MRKVFGLFVLLSVLTAAGPAQADWVKQFSDKVVADLFVVSPQALWAVADGSILVSPNGGATWQVLHTEQGAKFHAIAMVGPQEGWAVGEPGVVFQMRRTAEGPKWGRLQGVGESDFQCIYFRDAQTGWIGGAGGKLLSTGDGGQHWSARNFQFGGGAGDLRAIVFPDADHGVILLGTTSLLFSEDGGAQWKQLGFPKGSRLEALALQGQTLWLAGRRQTGDGPASAALWRSDDLGKSWRGLSSVEAYPGAATSIWFADATTGFIAIGGKVYATRDGAQTWSQWSDGSVPIQKLAGADANTLWGLSGGHLYRFVITVSEPASTQTAAPKP